MNTLDDNILPRPLSGIRLVWMKSLQNSLNLISLQRFVSCQRRLLSSIMLIRHIQLRVLQQLTIWTLGNPDRIRERMEEQKDSEQTYWV